MPTLRVVLEAFRFKRRPGEGFGDFCHRLGQARLRGMIAEVTAA